MEKEIKFSNTNAGSSWFITEDYEFESFGDDYKPCKHSYNIREEVVTYKSEPRIIWICPLVISSDGHETEAICLQCILDELKTITFEREYE